MHHHHAANTSESAALPPSPSSASLPDHLETTHRDSWRRKPGTRSLSTNAVIGARADESPGFRRAGLKRVSTLKLLPSRLVSRVYGAVNHLTL